jgi:glutathione S-transferase
VVLLIASALLKRLTAGTLQDAAGRHVVRPKGEQHDAITAIREDNGPDLLGDHVCAADFFLTMLMRWSRNMPRPASDWPHLAALIVRMKARPSFRALYEREGLSEWS